MPRRPIQFEQIKEERKLSILESALPLFAIHGVKSVSIDMVSEKAKCSHGLVYHYFKKVEQIYDELIDSESYKELAKEFTIDLNESAYPQIEKIVRLFLSIVDDSKETIAFTMLLLSDESKKSFYSSFLKLILKGQNDREVTGGKPEDIANCFIYLIKGLYQTKLNEKHPIIKVPSFDNVMNIFRRK